MHEIYQIIETGELITFRTGHAFRPIEAVIFTKHPKYIAIRNSNLELIHSTLKKEDMALWPNIIPFKGMISIYDLKYYWRDKYHQCEIYLPKIHTWLRGIHCNGVTIFNDGVNPITANAALPTSYVAWMLGQQKPYHNRAPGFYAANKSIEQAVFEAICDSESSDFDTLQEDERLS